jgi:hypothetical protein
VVYFLILLPVSRALKLLECDRAECGGRQLSRRPAWLLRISRLDRFLRIDACRVAGGGAPTGRPGLPWVPLS